MVKETTMTKGYRKTDIGVIPDDWNILRLDVVSKVVDSLHQTPRFVEDGFAMVRVADIKTGNLCLDGALRVGQEVFQNYIKNYKPNRGDIVLSRVGSYGVSSFVDTDEPFCMGQNTVVIVPSVENRYLYYVLNSTTIRQQIEHGSFGTGYKSLSLKNIKELKLQFPNDKVEQTTIATALSNTDRLIGVLEKLIAKKRNIKQGAMQELFTGKKHLPGFSEKWEMRLMGKLGKTYGGLSGKSKDDFQNGECPYIPFLNILNNPVIDTQYFDYVNLKPEENQNRAQKGDLFFNGSSETPEEVGMCSVLLDDVPNLYLNSFCFGFRLNNEIKVSGLYLSYFFRSDVGRRLVFFLAQGATRHNLSKTSFMKLEIPYPSYEEHVAIAQVFSDMDIEIKQLEKKLAKYRLIKQGMMQELLIGKTRLI